jgi:GntR family transcriptional regulator, transcriptional repressor for pyruvate dehydrogenase complex
MELRPIKTKRIYEDIIEQIKILLSNGVLKPGDKLLSERELAEKLSVSRASVREAIRALEMMGFVEIKVGGGTFVKKTSSDSIIQPLAMFIAVERGSFFEIYEIRKIFETASAYLASERATTDDLAKIEDILKKMKKGMSSKDSEKGEDLDMAFHFAIAESTHNFWLLRLLNTISESFHKTVSAARKQLFLTPGHPEKLMKQHYKIFQAIRDKDPRLARKCMMEHLNFAESEMAKSLKIKSKLK